MSCGFSVAYGMRMWHIVLLAISYRRYPPPLQSWAVTTVQTDCLQTRAGGDDPSTKCDDELSECTGRFLLMMEATLKPQETRERSL